MRISNFSQPPVIRDLIDARAELQRSAPTVYGPASMADCGAVVRAFAVQGIRAWSNGRTVQALDAEQSLVLDRIEAKLDELFAEQRARSVA
jgi:hypothetical protein